MAVVIVVVVMLALLGGVAFLVKRRRAANTSENTGPNEILQSPPTSFPSDIPPLKAATVTVTSSPEGPESPPSVAPSPTTPTSTASSPAPDEAIDGPDDDEVVAARFRPPGSRAVTKASSSAPEAATPKVYPLEPSAAASTAGPASTEPDATGPASAEATATESDSAEPAAAESATAGPAPARSLDDDDVVIDLDEPGDAVAEARPAASDEHDLAWRAVTLEPEPDAVDHVLQALINRARFRQVGVEEVATELVERADLRGEEVSDVLAELVGRADDPALDPERSSELVLFNDEVPSRPGQLTDFARLNPADKKRIIIRVLCLLVARSEDQQLPPRAGGESQPSTSWPLARAVWPTPISDDETDVVLPSRLAKSG
jgi:hypothetical protein